MKKLAIAMMMGVAALTATAQVNVQVCKRHAIRKMLRLTIHKRLRSSFMMEKVMAAE